MANALKYLTEEDFYLLIETLKENLETYKKNKLHIRNFYIKLSNGEEIYYNLHHSTIAHLLGIDINYLYSLGKYKDNSSYKLLEYIIYNPTSLTELSKNGLINYGILFSDNIFEKNMIFRELFTLDLNNMFFCAPLIVKDDSPNNTNFEDSRMLMAYKIPNDDGEEEYRIVTLSKVTHGKYRGITSHRYYDNEEDFKKDIAYFTNGQDISFVTEAKYYEKKDENISIISRSYEELLENTKRIDELNLPNDVDVLQELKNRYSIKCMALEGIADVLEANDEYEMLKRLYKVFINNENKKIYKDSEDVDKKYKV